MEDFAHKLTDVLEEAYHGLMHLEEEFLRRNRRLNISIREMHLVEYVATGGERGRSISEIADYLRVARPSVTMAVKKLEKRGYLTRQTSATDGRVVRVLLTREGRKVEKYHHQYHMAMAKTVEQVFTPEEQDCLIRAVETLNKFFTDSTEGTI